MSEKADGEFTVTKEMWDTLYLHINTTKELFSVTKIMWEDLTADMKEVKAFLLGSVANGFKTGIATRMALNENTVADLKKAVYTAVGLMAGILITLAVGLGTHTIHIP